MWYVLVVAFIVWMFKCVKLLRRGEQGGVVRLGRLMGGPLGPGVHWVWWPVEMLYRGNVLTGQQDLNLRVETGPVLKSKRVVLVPKEVKAAATIVGLEAGFLVLGSGFWVIAFHVMYLTTGYSMNRQEILGGVLWHLILAVGLATFAASWALPKLKNWARLMSLFFAGAVACGLLFVVARVFAPEWEIAAIFGLLVVVFQGWVFLCLFRPKVRQAFEEAKSFDNSVEYIQEPAPEDWLLL